MRVFDGGERMETIHFRYQDEVVFDGLALFVPSGGGGGEGEEEEDCYFFSLYVT